MSVTWNYQERLGTLGPVPLRQHTKGQVMEATLQQLALSLPDTVSLIAGSCLVHWSAHRSRDAQSAFCTHTAFRFLSRRRESVCITMSPFPLASLDANAVPLGLPPSGNAAPTAALGTLDASSGKQDTSSDPPVAPAAAGPAPQPRPQQPPLPPGALESASFGRHVLVLDGGRCYKPMLTVHGQQQSLGDYANEK